MHRSAGHLIVLVAGCAAAACSSSSNGGAGPGGGTEAGVIDSGSPVDGQATDTGSGGGGDGGDGGDAAGAQKPYVGSVLMVTNDTPGQAVSYGANGAGFTPYSAPACALTTGSCCFYPAGSGSSSVGVGAGTITVVDGSTTIVTYDETDAGYTEGTPAAWMPGDVLTFSAPGDVVSAFTGNVTAPPTFVLTSPAPGATSVTIPVSGDLALGWAAGSSSTVVWVQISGSAAGNVGGGEISCVFADTGTATVPKAMLAMLQSGDTGQLAAGRVSQTAPACDNADVSLQVASFVAQQATFQ